MRAPIPAGAIVCALGGAQAGWAALAAGHEVIACGAAPYAGLGVTSTRPMKRASRRRLPPCSTMASAAIAAT